jgi:glycosyltransferase involved in cell wall biosynthesis
MSDPMDTARPADAPTPRRRLVIVVRADPVICGHSGEARNLAEAARLRGFDDVRIVTWPIERLVETGLPLKPLDRVLPYSPGIVVERPEPIGDYKVPDGRYTSGMVGRLVELFTDGVPTIAMSLYLLPHALVVGEALAVARATGLATGVTTIAEAVGSDITNAVRASVAQGRFGAAAHLFSTYLATDHPVAVSEYTRRLIIAAAGEVDAGLGTDFASQCRRRIEVSYPAVASAAYVDLDESDTARALAARGLEQDGYVLFLSRLTPAKGVDDLIEAYASSEASQRVPLVVAGTGPAAAGLRDMAASSGVADRIRFFDDVDDTEKPHLMRGCMVYVLPSKPRPEFVETFGIALVEKMLAGGGPVITTATGGIPEAVGDAALTVPAGRPDVLAGALDEAVLRMGAGERETLATRARAHALQFDRMRVFDRLFERVGVRPLVTRPTDAYASSATA